jgi:hypothetical protein
VVRGSEADGIVLVDFKSDGCPPGHGSRPDVERAVRASSACMPRRSNARSKSRRVPVDLAVRPGADMR